MTREVRRVPSACIRREYQSRFSMCGRDTYMEFMFDNGEYAVKFYRDGSYLRVCEACVEAFVAKAMLDEITRH